MARGENPGDVLSIKSTLTYSATEAFGHASAGKDLCLSIETTGDDAGTAELTADGSRVFGKFLSLNKKGEASVMASGTPIILRKSAAAIALGDKIVGAGGGKVKSAPASAAGNKAGRGMVIEILETGDNGRIKVLLPPGA